MRKLLYLLLCSCLLQACDSENQAHQDEKPRHTPVVVVHLLNDPETLHPTNSASELAQIILDYTQKPVTRLDIRDLTYTPILVTGMPEASADHKRFTYTLRNDVRWDNGEPLRVEDIIFTLKAIKNPFTNNSSSRSNYDNIETIIPDHSNSRKFTVVAKEVNFQNPYLLGSSFYVLQRSHWDSMAVLDKFSIQELDQPEFSKATHPELQTWSEQFNAGENGHDPTKLTGLGPYKVTAWEPGQSITLTRKENWWGDEDTSLYQQANPRRIVFRILKEPTSYELAFKKGELDASTFISNETLDKLKTDTSFTNKYAYEYLDQYAYNFLAMNLKPTRNRKPYFTDQRVRRAMAFLVPVDDLVKTIAKGRGRRVVSTISPIYAEAYNNDLKLIPFNLDSANRLLDEAGWKDTDGDNIRDKVVNGKKLSMSFEFTFPEDPNARNLALIVQQTMKQAGVDMRLNAVGGQQGLMEAMFSRNFDMLFSSWSISPPPGDDYGQIWSTENFTNGGFNFTGFGNTYTDGLIMQSNTTIDMKERARYLKLLQAELYKAQPYIFMYSTKRKAVARKNLDPEFYNASPFIWVAELGE